MNPSSPIVSVIVPVFNTEAYLGECLDSILSQRLADLEVICVDDGSRDGSMAILEDYARRDPRVQIVRLGSNQGPGAARNQALEQARGDYVAFVDSDDLLHEEFLEALHSEIVAGDADIAMCLLEKFSDSGRGERYALCTYDTLIPNHLDGQSFTWRDIDDLFGLRFTSCNKLYRRDFLDARELRYPEGIFYEDLPFTFSCLLEADRLRLVRRGLYRNRRQRQSATTFDHGGRVIGAVEAMLQFEGFLTENDAYRELLRPFAAFRFQKLVGYFHKNDAAHMPAFYTELQKAARDPRLDHSPFMSDSLHETRAAVLSSDLETFLSRQFWQASTALARVRRQREQLREHNARLKARIERSRLIDVEERSRRRYRRTVRPRLRLAKRAPRAIMRRLPLPPRVRRLAGRARRKWRSTLLSPTPSPRALWPKPSAPQPPATKAPEPDITKAYPRASTENLYDAVDFLRRLEVDRLNDQVVRRIRRRTENGEPLRVTFLANDRGKWNATPLIEEMRGRGWDVRVALCLTDARGLDREGRRESYRTEREFFARIDPDLHDLYDPDADRADPVEGLETDVIFYQQPWGMKDYPRRMVGRALAAYMHYGFVIMANHGMHYNIATFHSYLWRYFTQTEEHRLMHLAHDPSAADRLVVTGYPKLDAYLDAEPSRRTNQELWGDSPGDARRIIYAPHHSLGKDKLHMSTFRWTGLPMLELARRHPEIRWVYKPHPTLKHSVVRNKVMTRDEYAGYERSWDELPNATVYDSGDYFELFRSSDGLITDCGSFLAEYLPTNNPIIWLVQADSIGLNDVGRALSSGFYEVRDLETFHSLFEQVVLRGDDPLIDERARAAASLFPGGKPSNSSVPVADHLAEMLTADR